VTIELWKDGSKIGEYVTDAFGNYFFGPNICEGRYEVKEVVPYGSTQTEIPGVVVIDSPKGVVKTNVNIGNYGFVDANGDGIPDGAPGSGGTPGAPGIQRQTKIQLIEAPAPAPRQRRPR
jgi:hypothetical protein